MKHRLVIIDGNAIVHRAWHAMPPLKTKDGMLVQAAYGFTTMLLKSIRELKPTHLAVTFDLPGKTFRHDAYPEYKATREKKDDEFYAQFPLTHKIVEAFNVPIYEFPGYEADDAIGTLSKKAPADTETIIVTGDQDTFQLVDEKTKVLYCGRSFSAPTLFDIAEVQKKFGLTPGQLIDYKTLRGDTSDNLPGIAGIGEVTATALLQKYGTVEGIYDAVKKSPGDFKPGVLKNLQDGKEHIALSKKMVTIVRDIKFPFKLDDTKMRAPDTKKVTKIFHELEFRALLPKIAEILGTEDKAAPKHDIKPKKSKTKAESIEMMKDAASFAERFGTSKRIAFRFAYSTEDRIDPKFSAIGAADEKGAAALPLDGTLPDPLAKLFASKAAKIGHDVKNDIVALAQVGVTLGSADDTMLMSYLLNPGSRAHKLVDLAFDAGGTGAAASGQDSLFPEERAASAGKEAALILKITPSLEHKLEEEKLGGVYRDIERPLAVVLAAMERHGIKVDTAFLAKMDADLRGRIEKLTKAITEAAGEEFNINSPAQLGKILFEKLQLSTKGIRKTSTGQLSTGADELEKLRGTHAIVEHIFEHREFSKLLSTYVAAIPQLIHPKTGRLHSHFNQAVAATGRLSSSDPNLQNIPIRTELGREIRKSFIADKGRTLIAADYSQIELRIAAHVADDKAMIEAFSNGVDIHQATAARIWNTKPDAVTFEQRRAAKAINFGILYGMGSNALAASAGVSTAEAKDFIKKYFAAYPSIQKYMDGSKESAKTNGYVETIFGRRRYLPEINSGVPFVRAEAERMAINMPIQGASADIIKIAMIALHARIAKEFGLGPDAKLKMLLQVHDELVFEADESIAKDVAVWIREAMMGAAKLKVPLDVEVEIGQSWGQMEAL